jgi:branched-chain amino acid aminotransferase
VLNGYDEAIVLAQDGHVSEGSAENLFIVRDGQLITPTSATTSSRASRATG